MKSLIILAPAIALVTVIIAKYVQPLIDTVIASLFSAL